MINALKIFRRRLFKRSNELALYEAAKIGNTQTVENLLARDVNVNAVMHDVDNFIEVTPLFIAAYKKHDAVVEKLLEAEGVEVDPAAHIARRRVQEPKGEGLTPLLVAVNNNNDNIVEQLLNAGADVNKAKSALYRAARWGNDKMVKLLRDAGADVQQAIYIANQNGETTTEELLINNLSSLSSADSGGGRCSRSKARRSKARRSKARRSKARRSKARRSKARRSKAHSLRKRKTRQKK